MSGENKQLRSKEELLKNIDYFKALNKLISHRRSVKFFIEQHRKFFNCEPSNEQVYAYTVNLQNAEYYDQKEEEYGSDYW